MKKALRLSVLFFFLIVLLIVSCEQQIITPAEVKQTPTIRGSVSIPAGTTLTGSDFFIRVMEGEKAVYTGRVNADGSFSVSGLSEEASYSILVTTEEPGDIKGSEKDISRATKTSGYGGWLSNVTASINEQAGVGSIKVKPLGTIKGVVKKDGAEDNYDTTVYIPGTSYLAMTDGEGKFSLFNVPQATYTLRYISNGYMARMVDNVVLYSESDTENPVTTVQQQTLIKNAGNLVGTISKIGSSDHSNITVMLSDGENVYTGSTATDGSLMITGIVPGTYSATISCSGFITQTVENIRIEAAKNTTVNPISLTANGGDIKGSVLMNDGRDKAGVLITAKSSDEKYSYTTSTDNEGKFTISNAYPGTYTLTLSKTGYAIETKLEVQSIAGQETNAGAFTFSSDYGTIGGTITDTKGNAIENAIVKVGEISIFTDGNGQFSKTGIPVGNHTVAISKEGYATQTLGQTITVESSKTVNIGIVQLASIYGSISGTVSVNDGKPTVGINISALSSDGKNSYSTLTDVEGKYSLSNMTAGQYTITAKQTGYSDSSETVAVVSDNEAIVPSITLISKYGSVSGKVALADSADNSGATVTLTFIADPTIAPTAVSGADGTYTFSNLTNAGQYSVTFSKDGYVSSTGTVVTVTLGQNQTIDDVTLRSLASKASGTATLAETQDYTGISVLLKATDNSVQYDATTDQQGSYVMARVKPGEYTLTVSKAGYVSKTVEDIIVESSTEKILDAVSLAVGVRSIAGTVTAELKTDHSGSLITATNLSDQTKVYSAISNSAGAYTLAGMVPGEYQIVISHTGYRTLTLPTVNVLEGTTKTLDAVEIEINRGTISGVSTLEGRTSSEGILIELLQGNETVETKNTNSAGEYSFYVPQGNYSGVRMTMTDFRTETVSESIALFADNYISIDNTELKATANSVYGTADVLTTDDDSAVTVSFDGHSEITAVVTEADGAFRFDHIPLGNYTLRIQRENCSDIIVPINVIASDGINLNTVTITPNTATIKGKVNLENGSSLSGVLVTVDMGTKTATGFTDASGRYEIGGISVADVYTVTYSKDGWQSDTQQISPKLERLEIREMDEITLIDTTAPVLNSVVINSGANTAADRHIALHFSASDFGSGVAKVMVTYDNVFDRTVTRHDYIPNMEWELPVGSGNGEKTIYVKVVDASGNESNTVIASVTLTDQKKEISGVLLDNEDGDEDGIIYWTTDLSPYYVIGNTMVEKGYTLVIEPGVDVQFAGDFNLVIEGKLVADGTESHPVSFYGVGNGINQWRGIWAIYENGSSIKNAIIENPAFGIQGYIDISNSIIVSESGYAFGSRDTNQFSGNARENEIKGNIGSDKASFIKNTIACDSSCLKNTFLSNNQFFNGGNLSFHKGLIENQFLDSCTISLNGTAVIYSTFCNCTLSINQGVHVFNEYEECEFGTTFLPSLMNKSNIVDCSTIRITQSRDSSILEIKMTGNFWGYDKTRELVENGINSNLSFIDDYLDDFTKTKVVIDQIEVERIPGIGFIGDDYYPSTEESNIIYSIGDSGPAGGIVFYDKGYYSEGWRYLEASPVQLFYDNSIYDHFAFGIYRSCPDSDKMEIGSAFSIGSGETNTIVLLECLGDAAYVSATSDGVRTENYFARICSEYVLNGFDDWFLPSINELWECKDFIAEMDHRPWIASSTGDSGLSDKEWFMVLNMLKNPYTKSEWQKGNDFTFGIIPIRAF